MNWYLQCNCFLWCSPLMCVWACLRRWCRTLTSPPPTCCGSLWRRPTLSLTHGCSRPARVPPTLLPWRCHSPKKWAIFHIVSPNGLSYCFIRQPLFKTFGIIVLNLGPVQSDGATESLLTLLLWTRKVRRWYFLMGNWRQGARWRTSAVRKRDQIRSCWSQGTTFCLTHFSWTSPLTRKMASWLA